jgi:Flp pilus assembly protein TadD
MSKNKSVQERNVRTIALMIIATTVLLLSLWIPNCAIAGGTEQQVCEVRADYYLGIEDYSEAIRRHVEIVRKDPDNALAHYHLGFALGMVGDRIAEVKEYQTAKALGLRSWDLFLNLGLAQVEDGEMDAATDSLRRAVFLGEDHPESHFNLALVDERRGLFVDAERETLAALRLNREQTDARNLLGVIYVQEGRTASASMVWRELIRDVPDYEPARKNLSILGNPNEVAIGETAAVLPRAVAVNAISDEPEPGPTKAEVRLAASPMQCNRR